MNPSQAIFTPPAANKDNSPVTPGEIVKFVLAVGVALTAAQIAAGATQSFPITFDDLDVTPSSDGTISIPLDSLDASAPGGALAPGDYAGIVTAVTALGVSSDPSPVGLFTIAAPVVTPNPPTALRFV